MRTYQRHGSCDAFGLVSPMRVRYALLLGISIFVAPFIATGLCLMFVSGGGGYRERAQYT